MRTTIDRSGRLVIPKSLRDQVGLHAGVVEIEVDGAALRVAPVADGGVAQRGRWLVLPAAGTTLTAGDVGDLRHADQE